MLFKFLYQINTASFFFLGQVAARRYIGELSLHIGTSATRSRIVIEQDATRRSQCPTSRTGRQESGD